MGTSALAAAVLWKLTESRAKPSEAFPEGVIWCDFYAGYSAQRAFPHIAAMYGPKTEEAGYQIEGTTQPYFKPVMFTFVYRESSAVPLAGRKCAPPHHTSL